MNRFEAAVLGRIQARADGIRDGRVLVACSGGGDSTALLVFLSAASGSLGLDLVVAHADHGLREDSERDAESVRRLCRALDLDLVEARLDVRAHAQRTGEGMETAARDLRWAWLKAEAASCGAEAVATGHTLDDHTETILVRLARGGGTGSLTPLPARQGLRWSPFVQTRREELRAYLESRAVPWQEDATNLEPITVRNRLRRILGPLRKVAPALDRHLWETHLQVDELRAFKDRQVEAWREGRWRLCPGPALALRQEDWHPAELRWVLETAFRQAAWPREADLLRGLGDWMVPHLARRPRKGRTWGGWRLDPHGPPGEWPALSWILSRTAEP